MKRNKSERSVESVKRDERRYWKIDSRILKEDDVKDVLKDSFHGHIFIISWWLKSKFVTLGNFFKTSHLKKFWLLKKSSETSHLKNCDFWKFIFRNQSLVIDYHWGVIDYTSTDMTPQFKFWKSKYLEALVIDYTSLKWFENV